MDTFVIIPKILVQALAVALILLGSYLFFNGWSNVDIRTGKYSYISENERNKRSIRAGIASILLIIGVLFFITQSFSDQMTLGDFLSTLAIGVCLAPIVAILAFFRMRRDLWTYTKTKDDVVFSDENKKPKD